MGACVWTVHSPRRGGGPRLTPSGPLTQSGFLARCPLFPLGAEGEEPPVTGCRGSGTRLSSPRPRAESQIRKHLFRGQSLWRTVRPDRPTLSSSSSWPHTPGARLTRGATSPYGRGGSSSVPTAGYEAAPRGLPLSGGCRPPGVPRGGVSSRPFPGATSGPAGQLPACEARPTVLEQRAPSPGSPHGPLKGVPRGAPAPCLCSQPGQGRVVPVETPCWPRSATPVPSP